MDTASGNDRARLAQLLDCYGNLLTEKQFTAIDLYYQEDFTLSEISEQTGITRQGVWDNIKRGERFLFDIESKLHLVDRLNDLNEKLTFAKQVTQDVKDYASQKFFPADMIKNLEKMVEMFKELIN